MFSSSAPYVVTIIMSVVTWALTNFYNDISQTPYLRYEITNKEDPSGANIRSYVFENTSPKRYIKDLEISLIRVGDQNPIFSDANVKSVNVAPWSIRSKPRISENSIIQNVNLPSGKSFELQFPVNKSQDMFLFASANVDSAQDNDMNSVKIYSGFNSEVFLVNNYIYVVFVIAGTTLIILGISAIIKKCKADPGEGSVVVRIEKGQL